MLLPFPSAEQLPRSREVTFLLQEKLTTTDRIARPTHTGTGALPRTSPNAAFGLRGSPPQHTRCFKLRTGRRL